MSSKPKKSLFLVLSFLVSVLLISLIMGICGIYPFGARSLGVQDMTNQYLSMLSSLRDLLTGKASAWYLPSMALGGNMLGLIAYFLASPLNWLTCVFPRENILLAVSLLYILRVGLAGLTMAVYTGSRHGWGWHVLFTATAYALMAYNLAYSINYLWQDCMILLPLVALGIRYLLENRGRWLYVISLAASLICNFYIGYMICIFAVLFFVARGTEKRGLLCLKKVTGFGLSSLLAGGLAAVILVPAFLSLAGSKATFSLSSLGGGTNFRFPEMFSKLFAGTFDYEEIMENGLPQIFCGTTTVVLAILFFFHTDIPRRQKIATAGLLAILFLSFWLSGADYFWNGFNKPTWYNYRFSFLLSFLLTEAADETLTHERSHIRFWHLLVPPFLLFLLALLALSVRQYDFFSWREAVVSVVFAVLICLLLGVGKAKYPAGNMIVLLLLVCHVADLGVNGVITLSRLTASSVDPAQLSQYIRAKSAAVRLIDTGNRLERVESEDAFSMNRVEPMLFGYDGITHYSSTISQKSLDFLQKLGITRFEELFDLYNNGVTAAADSFLGIRYLISQHTAKPYEPSGSAGGYTVYRNDWALPVGFTTSGDITEPLEDTDCFSYLQSLYVSSAPEVREDLFVPAELTAVSLDGVTETDPGHYVHSGAGSGSVTYALTAQADGPLYCEIRMPDFPGSMVFVNDAFRAYYGTAQTNGSLYLGEFSAGEKVTVRLGVNSALHVTQASFVTEDDVALESYCQALSEGGCSLQKISGHIFSGTFTAGEGDEMLLLTLPWDPGWQILLDGEEVEPQEVQGCLMAVPVEAGVHQIQMKYVPPGAMAGLAITGAAIAGSMVLLFLDRRKSRSGKGAGHFSA